MPAIETPAPMTPERILNHASAHTFSLDAFDFVTPIDRTRLFLCPTLTPLYYTDVYRTLSDADVLRYNQLTALCFSEMIGFFEGAFVSSLRTLSAGGALEPTLAECVTHFMDEEEKHREMWRRLNRLSEPGWYATRERHIVRIPRLTEATLAWFAARPQRFPVVVWIMLALEEHSLEIGRRCIRLPADAIEPRYRAVYLAHMQEEVRHIHTDFNLLRQLIRGLSRRQLRRTVWLFDQATETFFLRPKRAAVRVIDQLLRERPALRPQRRTIVRQLSTVSDNADYRGLMLSAETTPMAFALSQELRQAANGDAGDPSAAPRVSAADGRGYTSPPR